MARKTLPFETNISSIDKAMLDAKRSQILSLAEADLDLDPKTSVVKNEQSVYSPSEEDKEALSLIRKHFTDGHVTMWRPRREFNDLSVIGRAMVDQMSFNTYQPNNGEPYPGDEINSWRSNAMRPIVRNKIISVAAHSLALLVFPKIFAYNDESEDQHDAALVMKNLLEYSGDKIDYPFLSLRAVLTALWSPASFVYEGYTEIFRPVKTEKDANGKWKIDLVEDEVLSGFQGDVVPVDEIYVENFYEQDIQKQGWVIWRRVRNHDLCAATWGEYPNFQYVKAGIQNLFNDANQTFYEVYDSTMRQNLDEEILYWNRRKDLFLVSVNGILLTDADNPNPRNDKRYPFAKFGFEFLDEGRCFYYKSLAFKMMQDANIINTLYPMVIDGTYLALFQPAYSVGADTLPSDVMVPGANTTMTDPNFAIKPIFQQSNIGAGMATLAKVEDSISENTPDKVMQQMRGAGGRGLTNYQMSAVQNEIKIILGLFSDMIGSYVKQIGTLMVGDILQYLTIADANKISGDSKLIYKTFLLHNKKQGGKNSVHKIKFDNELPTEPISEKKAMELSLETFESQGGMKNKETTLWRVQPELFRNLKYIMHVSPDVLNPLSEEMKETLGLEIYDRGIANPFIDQEQLTRDFLLGENPLTKNDPDKYMKKNEGIPGALMNQGVPPAMPNQTQPGANPGQPAPSNPPNASPLNALKAISGAPRQ